MPEVTPQQLLAEFEELLRSMPPRTTLRHTTNENYAWFGRAKSLIRRWDSLKAVLFDKNVSDFGSTFVGRDADSALRDAMTTIYEAINDLKLSNAEFSAVAISQGEVFRYFDTVRQWIEQAQADLLFVDPYLDADFVAKFLPFVRQGTKVRLLTSSRKLDKLLPAVGAYRAEKGLDIEIKIDEGLHDRYLFVDRRECYFSGGSFKDGAKNAPALVAQISDAFSELLRIYEAIWVRATAATIA